MLQSQSSPHRQPDLQQFQTLGARLNGIAARIDITNLTADPQRAEIERDFYASGETTPPIFTSPDTSPLALALSTEFSHLSLPDGPESIRGVYSSKMTETALMIETLAAIGDRNRLVAASSLFFGTPSPETLDEARAILAEPLLPDTGTGQFDRLALRDSYTDALSADRLSEWRVLMGDAPQSYVSPESRTVTVGNRLSFTAEEIQRLTNHEIKGHVYRAANGYEAHPAIAPALGTGLDGYNATEEGVAVYGEYAAGLLSQPIMRTYAARALAVQSVLDGGDFIETYELLRSHTMGKHGAFKNALRAHRGEGLIRDHIYLEGYLVVKQFAERGGDMKELYAGKVGIHHLAQVARLRQEGFLPPAPTYFPDYLED
jgi:hypothetical protein